METEARDGEVRLLPWLEAVAVDRAAGKLDDARIVVGQGEDVLSELFEAGRGAQVADVAIVLFGPALSPPREVAEVIGNHRLDRDLHVTSTAVAPAWRIVGPMRSAVATLRIR